MNIEVYPFKKDDLVKETNAYWLFARKKLLQVETTMVGKKISEEQRALVNKLLYGEPWQYATSHLRDMNFMWEDYRLDEEQHRVKEEEHTQLLAQIKADNLIEFKHKMNHFKGGLRMFIDSLKKYKEAKNDSDNNKQKFNNIETNKTLLL